MQSYYKNGFLNIKAVGTPKELNDFLELTANYNDGQGRSHDILDEEIYE